MAMVRTLHSFSLSHKENKLSLNTPYSRTSFSLCPKAIHCEQPPTSIPATWGSPPYFINFIFHKNYFKKNSLEMRFWHVKYSDRGSPWRPPRNSSQTFQPGLHSCFGKQHSKNWPFKEQCKMIKESEWSTR